MASEFIDTEMQRDEIEIRFWGQDRKCPLCLRHYGDESMAMRFLDLEDQVNHIRAVHSFFLRPKPPGDAAVVVELKPTF